MEDTDQIPQALDAEKAVLGAILVRPELLAEARERLRVGWFYVTAHRLIFQAMHTLADSGMAIDTLTVADALRSSGQLEKVGGISYVASLGDFMPRLENIRTYAEIVRDRAMLRAEIRLARDIVERATSGEHRAEAVGAYASARLDRIRAGSIDDKPESRADVS